MTALSTLYSLVAARPSIATALSSAGAFTMFAPINASFAAVASLPSLSADQVTNVLLDHVIQGRFLSSDLPVGTITPTTLLGQTISITNSANGVTVQGQDNTIPANVIIPNVPTCNGVVHAIDEVLIPSGLRK